LIFSCQIGFYIYDLQISFAGFQLRLIDRVTELDDVLSSEFLLEALVLMKSSFFPHSNPKWNVFGLYLVLFAKAFRNVCQPNTHLFFVNVLLAIQIAKDGSEERNSVIARKQSTVLQVLFKRMKSSLVSLLFVSK